MNGILIVDKEKGWTSHDVCAFIRSKFKINKVGHAGTLDPQATGLLVVLLGRATKLSQSLAACDKEYNGTMQLGIKTDTHDQDGKLIAEADWRSVTQEKLEAVLSGFRGDIEQMPPMVSALKHKGVRLYKLARQGKVVEREARKITVYQLDATKIHFPNVDFFARVSKGTYLRTLVNDIGEKLECYATLASLRRTRCGEFGIEDAVTVPQLKEMKTDSLGRWVRMATLAYSNS